MGRLIDADKLEPDMYTLRGPAISQIQVNSAPTVEAISKADIQKALKEGSKDISENVLAIVREEYISKADYEARLKADMVAMLTEIQLEIEEIEIDNNVLFGFEPVSKTSAFYEGVSASSKVIQQKINALKGGSK